MANRVTTEIEDTFEISHRMTKRMDLEVNNVAKVNLRIGESRRDACNAFKELPVRYKLRGSTESR